MESATITRLLLMRGNRGEAVVQIKKALRAALGDVAGACLADRDLFDADTGTRSICAFLVRASPGEL